VMPTTEPATVGMPRSLSAFAIPFRLVIPDACISYTMGARFAALSEARAWRASMPARRGDEAIGCGRDGGAMHAPSAVPTRSASAT
jgi:hypothetical protein